MLARSPARNMLAASKDVVKLKMFKRKLNKKKEERKHMNGNGIGQTRIYTKPRPLASVRYLARQQVAPIPRPKLGNQIKIGSMNMARSITTTPGPKGAQLPEMAGKVNMNAPINPPMKLKVGEPMFKHPHYS